MGLRPAALGALLLSAGIASAETQDGFEALLASGLERLRAGAPPDAVPLLDRAVAERPQSAEARFYLGLSLARSGRLDEGILHLEEAKRLEPASAATRFELGVALERRGALARAIEEFDVAARLDPARADAMLNAATLRHRRGEDEGALEALARAARVRPLPPDGIALRGDVLLARGREEEAEAVLREGAKAHPDCAPLFGVLGKVLERRGKPAEASAALDRAIAAGADTIENRNRRASARSDSGRLAEAEEDLREVLRRDPLDPRALYAIGLVLREQGRDEEARAALRRYEELAPLLDAIATNERSRTRDPLDLQAHTNLVHLRVATGDDARAREALGRALAIDPTLRDDPLVRGLSFYFAGNVARARAEFEAARRANPELADPHLYLQRCAEREGNAEEASRHREAYETLAAKKRR